MIHALRIALRHLAERRRRSVLTVAGVALGVAVFVFTVAMMDGLVVYFTRRLVRVSPQLAVQPENLAVSRARDVLRRAAAGELLALSRPPVPDDRPTIRGATALSRRIREVPGVLGVSVAATVSAVVNFGTVAEPAALIGVEPDRERDVTELPSAVIRGAWSDLESHRDGAVLGAELANRLGADVGDRLFAVGENGDGREIEVVGVMATGLSAFDDATAFVNLTAAQGLAGWGADEGSEIRIRTAALTGLGPLRSHVEAITGHAVETWEEANRASLQLFRTIGITTYLLTGFVLVVAGLGIANKVTTTILEKERDIAILRSYGFSRGAVRTIFVAEGVTLGAVGAALGCAVAAAVIAFLTAHPIRFAPREGSVVSYTELYLNNDPRYYVVIAVVALVIAALAALFAVRRAVRVVPVEVLRGSV